MKLRELKYVLVMPEPLKPKNKPRTGRVEWHHARIKIFEMRMTFWMGVSIVFFGIAITCAVIAFALNK